MRRFSDAHLRALTAPSSVLRASIALVAVATLTACGPAQSPAPTGISPTPAPTGAPPPSETPGSSVAPGGTFGALTFDDEFDGPTIDTTKWIVADGHQDYWPETPWRRNYMKDNAFIEDGALVIRVAKEDVGFSSASVATGDAGRTSLFEQAFGRFEARVRFPTQQGHWCAFWLWNTSEQHIDGSGRDGTEIDILEKAVLIDQAEHNLHWDGYGAEHQTAGHVVTGAGLDDGGWHTIRLDWYPDQYVFFVDGVETWRTSAGGVSQVPDFVILSDEIGNFGTGPGAWGVGPIEDATLPDYYSIDYVRVYAYVPPSGGAS